MRPQNPSKVYFTDMHVSTPGDSLQKKLTRLVKAAGIETIDFNKKFTAIKLHFGEPGNLAFLRPNYAKTVADIVRELGGMPFLTDCNTLYVGRRKNALEHLSAAYENGYNPFTTGCHVIIADGLKGTDETEVEINGEYVKKAKIGTALADADVIISMTHFKGHQSAGYGGVFKNIGMGGGSRAGKMEMHYDGKPKVNPEKCVGCGTCVKYCANSGVSIVNKKAVFNYDNCVGCGKCIGMCNHDAISPMGSSDNDKLNCRIAEYAYAVIKGKPAFHISFVIDVSPECDCFNSNDIPLIADVGMFASFDPVALDMACADAVNKAPIAENSVIGSHCCEKEHDVFTLTHPNTNWKVCCDHAEKIGLGRKEYELKEVK